MKKKIINIKHCILYTFLLVGISACSDSFDTHYSEETGVAPDLTLWQLIEQDANLSKFAEVIKKTGYDVVLSSSQSFTVWAPDNDDLQDLDMTDVAQLNNIIRTHIARFKYVADRKTSETVFTMNAKRIPFQYNDGVFTMKGSELTTLNHLASNGILHTMKEQIPFVKNVWEYLQDMDSVRNYFEAFHTKAFYPSGSKIIDYIKGMPVYDSIFFEFNEMWNLYRGVGYLNDEDSLYTMILPTNAAWRTAYEQRKPYFETWAPDADSVQHWNTKYAIVQNLVFRGSLDAPGQKDSLISTRGNVFYHPEHLFPTEPAKIASNGLVYISDNLEDNYWESWQHPLLVEAERSRITLEKGNEAKIKYTYLPSNTDIPSKACYLVSSATNSKTTSTVLFVDIVNTLKADYNVFAVFAPIRYTEPNLSKERTKILYDIQQLDRTTVEKPVTEQVWRTLVGASNSGKVPVNPDNPNDRLYNETDSVAVKKMLLTRISFPEANYNEKVTTIRVKLISRISAADARNDYNNRMLLDYIILEPVR